MAGLVELASVRVDISSDLGPQRRGQHLPGTTADQLIQQRPINRRERVITLSGLFLDYREHKRAFPNQRANAGS